MQLDISNVINVQVSQAGAGLGEYNTSNLALFTRETAEISFGTDGYKIYKSPTEVGVDFGTDSACYAMANSIFSQKPNILSNNGYLVIITYEEDETLAAAVTRTAGLVQYFGIITSEIPSQVNMLAAAAVVEAMTKIAFFVSHTSADVETGGMLDLLRSGSFTHSRGLFYGVDENNALLFLASYAGRALSVVFSGSNTTQTMHLKSLSTIDPDSTMTQTLLNKCQAAGVDVYVSIQGVAKTFISGANSFFDQVYNLLWFVGAIQIGTFNILAQTSSKVAQTEDGVDAYKSAIRQVCKQAVANQYVAPGTWTSPNTFGTLDDFYANIEQKGYYIYSLPIAQQSAADRADRKAPLVQIAIKEAGAIHSGNILIAVNA